MTEQEVNAAQLVPITEAPITYRTLVTLSSSPTVPEQYRDKPNDMLAVALMGRDLGIGAMTAINNIDMIDGTVSMRAKLMSALIHKAGHIVKTLEQSAEACRLECYRWHDPSEQLIKVGVVEYTLEDATTAKDTGKGTYKKHPKAMLTNRALTLAARTFYGDALAGVGYTPDEVGRPEPPEVIHNPEMDANEVAAELDGEVVEAEVVDEDG